MRQTIFYQKFVLFIFSLTASTALFGQSIGIAKDFTKVGRDIYYHFYIENLSPSVTMSNISIMEDLDSVFNAGNYTFVQLNKDSGPASLTINAGYDGSSDQELIGTSSSLAPAETATLTLFVHVDTLFDQGFGLGYYSNQVTINADGSDLSAYSDVSDFGNDPDPNGNSDPSDAGEDDPTIVDFLEYPTLGAAKYVHLNGTQITFDYYLKNLGNCTMNSLSLPDDLDAVFGAGNYSIITPAAFIDDPGTVNLAGGFDGSSNTDILSSGSSLSVGDTAQIRLVLNLTTVTDQGLGFGTYSNQVTIEGISPTLQIVNDLSDYGVDPDPNGNSNPKEAGENDPTIFTIGEELSIGVAKTASVTGSTVSMVLYLENLGNIGLQSLSLVDDLNAAFGAGNYYINSSPTFIDDPGTITLNAGYDGNFDTQLISSGALALGDTAQIHFSVFVLSIADLGFGLGNYQNQAFASGSTSSGGWTTDMSDDGTDPDPNGNGNPMEAGEDDPTTFSIAPSSSIGIAKQYVSGGMSGVNPIVYLYFTVTNYSNQTVSSLTISENLNSVYGVGNFSHYQDPEQVSGANTLNYNAAFNGNTNTSMLNAGCYLDPGETVTFRIGSIVTNITDQGFGLGIYQNQVTINGLDPSEAPVSDDSQEGANPDPDLNGDPTDNSDPTVIDLNESESIGVALDVTVAGNQVTFDYYLENLGTTNYDNLSLVQPFDAVFGPGNYSISSPPTFIDDPGTISLAPSFDGSTTIEMVDPGASSLTAGDTARISITVDVLTIQNVQLLGLGNYANQVTFFGKSSLNHFTSDLSDFGTDPDPDGDFNANEAGENDATTFSITVDAVVGAAKQASVADHQVTLNLYLENLGASATTQVSLIDNLDLTFGAGNYSITTPPSIIVDPGTLVLNAAYDGSSDTDILSSSSTMNAGATAQIQMVLDITNESDQGTGFGIYANSAQAQCLQPNGAYVIDYSDDGTDPDPNGNGDPGEAGEEDPTPIIINGSPAIGIAKKAYVMGTLVTFDFYIENLGDSTLTNVYMEDSLNPVFGSGNYSIQTQPQWVSGANTLSLSPQFFGFNIFNRIVLTGYLRPGETEHFRTQINVNTVTDVGNGFGIYFNGVTVTATSPDGTSLQDISDDGIDPDPNGNGNAGDAGEDDATFIAIGDEANLGIAKDVSVSNQAVTFTYYLENFGGSTLNSLSVIDDLDSVFGAGNYSINTGPTFIDDPGTLTLNAAFDGSALTDLISGGTLAALDTASFSIVVDVTTRADSQGLGIGVYTNQVTVEGSAPLGTQTIDYSDFGTDPDPNGNGFANDSGEDDPTPFQVFPANGVVGIAETAAVTGNQVLFDIYIENFGNPANPNDTLQNFDLPMDLDALFGAGNYTISSPPLQAAPHGLVLNTNFDGSSDTQLIASGTTAPSVTEHIQLEVTVSQLIDQGSGYGVYSTQLTINAETQDSNPVTDTSDNGTDPDPNGNNNPNEAGENDPTPFTLAQLATLGIAKTASVSGRNVTIDFFLENMGNIYSDSVQITEDLDALLGSGNYTITSAPAFIVDPGTLTLNGGFDGSATTSLLSAGSTLAFGATAQIRFTLNVTTVTNQGSGLGIYSNQVTVQCQSPDTTAFSDLSDNGTDPDPDGDSNPNEAGENDPTPIVLESDIGDFVWIDLNGDGVQDAGEPGLAGIDVYLDLNTNGSLDGGEPVQTTNASGAYNFPHLSAATYSVNIDPSTVPTGFVLTGGTLPLSYTLYAGEDYNDADFGYQQQDATIGDFVWNDLNGDGVQDVGEPGLSGVTVFLDINTNGSLDAGEPSDTTDGVGAFDITDLPTGTYSVQVDASTVPVGFVLTGGTNPVSVTIAAGEDYNDADFGYQQQDATIGDLVWNDLNGDGVQDAGEPGMSGATVFLDLNTNGVLDAGEPNDTTDGTGAYDIIDLPTGTYSVRVDPSTIPVGFVLTGGTIPTAVNLAAGEDYNDADFGYQQQDATIGDFVWNDLNGDGIQDAGEPGLAGVTVFLDLNSNSLFDAGEPNDVTDASGAYDITSLATGVYPVQPDPVTVPGGFVLTSGIIPLSVPLAAGEDFNNADFGYQQQDALIGDLVFNDLDGNGLLDPGEPGIANVTLELYDDANNNRQVDAGEALLGSTITDANGAYSFPALPAGNYLIDVTDVNQVLDGFLLTSGTDPFGFFLLTAGETRDDIDFGYFDVIPGLGLAKAYNGYQYTSTDVLEVYFEFTIANLGNVPLTTVQIDDDLRAAFPLPLDIQDAQLTSSTLSVNPNFDGIGDTQILTGTDTLAVGQSATILMTVVMNTNGDVGVYYNSAMASGFDPLNNFIEDTSDQGTNPDANNNGSGDDQGESDPTLVLIRVQVPTIGTIGEIILAALLGLAALVFIRRRN